MIDSERALMNHKITRLLIYRFLIALSLLNGKSYPKYLLLNNHYSQGYFSFNLMDIL